MPQARFLPDGTLLLRYPASDPDYARLHRVVTASTLMETKDASGHEHAADGKFGSGGTAKGKSTKPTAHEAKAAHEKSHAEWQQRVERRDSQRSFATNISEKSYLSEVKRDALKTADATKDPRGYAALAIKTYSAFKNVASGLKIIGAAEKDIAKVSATIDKGRQRVERHAERLTKIADKIDKLRSGIGQEPPIPPEPVGEDEKAQAEFDRATETHDEWYSNKQDAELEIDSLTDGDLRDAWGDLEETIDDFADKIDEATQEIAQKTLDRLDADEESDQEPEEPDIEPTGDEEDVQESQEETPSGATFRAPFTLVTDPITLKNTQDALEAAHLIGLDLETTGYTPAIGHVRLLSLATEAQTFVIDCFAVDPAPLWPLLAQKELIIHNREFDLPFLEAIGFVPGIVHDTIEMARHVYGGRAPVSLKSCAQNELGIDLDKSLQASDWSGVLTEPQLGYAATDAAILIPLAASLMGKLRQAGMMESWLQETKEKSGHWITIGSSKDGEGGSHVFVRGEKIVKGAKGLKGKDLDRIDHDEDSKIQSVVYHGTPHKEGVKFSDDYVKNMGDEQAEELAFGPGLYFTEDEDKANEYAQRKNKDGKKEFGHVHKVKLDIKRPFNGDTDKVHIDKIPPNFKPQFDRVHAWHEKQIAEAKAKLDRATNESERQFAEKNLDNKKKAMDAFDHGEFSYNQLTGIVDGKRNANELLAEMGYDGIQHVDDRMANRGGKAHKVWIAFKASQIKHPKNVGESWLQEHEWEEEKHPRDHGKFATSQGGKGDSGGPRPEKPKYVGKDIVFVPGHEFSPPDGIAESAKKSRSSMSDEHQAAVDQYTGGGWVSLGKKMRECPDTLDCVQGLIRKRMLLVEEAISQCQPLPEGTVLYRGLDLSQEASDAIFEAAEKCLTADGSFSMPAITSTTLNPLIASTEFGSGFMFHIKAKTGLYVEPFTNNPGEFEVIQSHKTRYKVVGIEKNVKAGLPSQIEGSSPRTTKVIYLEEV